MSKKKKHIPLTLRRIVWNTYIGEHIGAVLCPICNITVITQLNFSCGHVVSEHNGGHTVVENLRPICSSCNHSMGTQHMFEFNESLHEKKKKCCIIS